MLTRPVQRWGARHVAVLLTGAALVVLCPEAQGRIVISYPSPGAQFSVTENGVLPLGGTAYVTAQRGPNGELWWNMPRPPDLPTEYFDELADPCTADAYTVTCDVAPGSVLARGGAGNDQLVFGTHLETTLSVDVDAGAGDDYVSVGGNGARSIEGGPGTDTIQAHFSQGSDTSAAEFPWTIDLSTRSASPRFSGASAYAFSGFENIDQERNGSGSRGNHRLIGDDGPNTITGQKRYINPITSQPYVGARGDDTIEGGGGDDTLYGQSGDDRISGGAGADKIFCGEGEDTVVDARPEDTIAADCEILNRLDVALEAGAIGTNDVFELKLTLQHSGAAGDPAIGSLAHGGGSGVTQHDAIAGTGPKPTLFPILGPVPGYPVELAGALSTAHTLAYAVETPGTTLLQARFTGVDAAGKKHEDAAAVKLEASYRTPTRLDLDALFAGGLIMLLDKGTELRERLTAQLDDALRRSLRKSGWASGMLKPTPLERALAQGLGLPDDALAWLPNATPSTGPGTKRRPSVLELTGAYMKARDREILKVGREAVDRTLVTPFAYWRDFLFEPSEGHRARQALEMSRMASEGASATAGYLGTAKDFYTSPAAMQDAWAQVPALRSEAEAGLRKLSVKVGSATRNWVKLAREDPAKAVEQLGTLSGRIDGEIAVGWLESAAGGKVNQALSLYSKARKGAAVTEATSEVLGTTRRLAPTGATSLERTPALGNLNPTQVGRIQGVIGELNAKFGVKIQLRARPINEHAARVKGGVGKIEAIGTMGLTPDDVVLGAPQKWLGQSAYYRPRLPANFKSLNSSTQARYRARYKDKLREYRQFQGDLPDKTGKTANVHRALKKGGGEFKLGRSGKVVMELEQVTDRSGAVLIRYKRLVVNGRPVFTGKPRPIVSDMDIDAVVDELTGRHLPPSIRGQLELELMDRFRKLSEEGVLPWGFHGWTHSGFDLTTGDYRNVLKYMLMYMDKDEAAKVAAKYAKLYGTTPDEFLRGLTTGKMLVKITAAGVVP